MEPYGDTDREAAIAPEPLASILYGLTAQNGLVCIDPSGVVQGKYMLDACIDVEFGTGVLQRSQDILMTVLKPADECYLTHWPHMILLKISLSEYLGAIQTHTGGSSKYVT